jgi:hypothetical protein
MAAELQGGETIGSYRFCFGDFRSGPRVVGAADSQASPTGSEFCA